MDKKLKISSTAYRVLLLLQKLNQTSLCIDELNKIFSETPEIERLFSKEVILKYISTLRMAGCDIEKPSSRNGNCYVLNKALIKINFSEEEIEILAMLKTYAEGLQQEKFLKNYSSFIEKLKKYLEEKQVKKLEENFSNFSNFEILNKFKDYERLIKKLEKFITDNQRVEIKYIKADNGQQEIVITKLKKIQYSADFVSIIYYDLISGQSGSIKISEITDIKQLPSRSGEGLSHNPVIFKLKGRLAKSYRLYEKEKISETNEKTGELTITAYPEDIDSLLLRLLKYGENCELLYPRQLRNKMIKLINSTLENYKTSLSNKLSC